MGAGEATVPPIARIAASARIVDGVHYEVGPVPSSSVLSWVSYARDVLARNDMQMPDEVVTSFQAILDEWTTVAEQSAKFRWSTDVPVDVAEYLVHAFYRIAQRLADEAEMRGYVLLPVDSDEFNWTLVRSLLDALSKGGGSAGEFAEHLRSFWPGLPPEL
jgi:hypothetical protein